MRAYVSIHDLMPETMDRVEHILKWLDERSVPPVTLLVVPGKPWTTQQLDRIRGLSAKGHELAAHGWFHHTRPRRLSHRIHAALISRNVAEHLDLDSHQILELLHRSRNWFVENELPAPSLYVPPAWALGPLSKADLANAPFEHIETTRGMLRKQGSTFKLERLALTGYEADTWFRKTFLRFWNQAQQNAATRGSKTLRMSIHPNDLHLRLRDQIDSQVRAVTNFVNASFISP